MNSVIETIKGRYGALTKKQKGIADYMLANSDEMCFVTLKMLASQVGVSEMTILNLCTALGYANFNELKYEFRKQAAAMRKEVVSGSDSYVLPYIAQGELEDSSGLFAQMCQEELDGINTFLKHLNAEEYYRAAHMVCAADRVVIFGRGVANQLSGYMHTRLTINGIPCITVDTESGDEVQSSLHFLGRGTLGVPISFPDYYFMTVKLTQFAKEKGAKLLGFTDSTRAEIAALCDMCLYCPTGTRLFLNSLTTPMMAANFLTMAVSVEKNRRGGDRESLSTEFSRLFDGGGY